MLIGEFIYELHPFILGGVVLAATISVAVSLVLLCRRYIRIVETEDDTFKISAYSHASGIAFAILLGLIIVTSWTSYDHTDDLVRSEVNYISDLYQLSEYMDDHTRDELRLNLKKYINYVIEKEWLLLHKGEFSKVADSFLVHNFHIIYRFMPLNKKQETVQAEMNKVATSVLDKRRVRNINARPSLPPIMWVILIMSNLISFLLLALAIEGPLFLHIILQSLYALVTGLMFLLVVVLDRPFYDSGGGITSEPFKNLLLEWKEKENQPGRIQEEEMQRRV